MTRYDKDKARQYYQDNREKRLMYGRQYYQKNKERALAYEKQYRQSHKKEIAETKKRYRNNRKARDIDYRLRHRLRKRFNSKITKTLKIERFSELLGCTIAELKKHLEMQFHDGMTWDSWGVHGWHIDHIIPLSYFNLADPEQQKRAFHYTNLRPLWATDNRKKGSKIIEGQLILL